MIQRTAPIQPTSSTAPTLPRAPTAPIKPTAPTLPTAPTAPIKPTFPVLPTTPIKPAAPILPTAPIQPTSSTTPIQPAAPTAPIQPSHTALIHPSDFGNFLSKKHDNDAVRKALTNRWAPEEKGEFPVSHHIRGGERRSRRANPDHLKRFPWLAISRHEEHWGAWCANCALMGQTEAGGRNASNQKLGNLVTRPLRDFSDLTGNKGALSVHQEAKYHQSATAAVSDYLQRLESNQEVTTVLLSAKKREIERTRAGLASIVDTIKLAAIQNIPLRGHRDDGRIDPSGEIPSNNDGNFRTLLRLRLQSGDSALQEHLRAAPSTALYTSKTAQNEILRDMLEIITQKIASKVEASPLWALLADETTDRANREQLTVVVRYLDTTAGKCAVREDPVALVDVFDELGAVDAGVEVKLSGENLGRVILAITERVGLNKKYLIAQCYDGAAAMSSVKVGVAAQVLKVAPLAHYYHCAMHGLNLATSKVNTVGAVRNAMGTMEAVITFVSDGAKRGVMLKQAQRKTGRQRQSLVTLCQTRFVERHTAVQRFCDQFGAIVEALKMMTEWPDTKTSSKAAMMLSAMGSSDFLVGIAVVKTLAGLLRPVSLALQEQGADLVRTMELVGATADALVNLREAEAFVPLMTEAQTMGKELEVELSKPRTAYRSTCRANAGEDLDVTGYYRINVMLPALDAVRTDMESRFGVRQSPAGKTHHKQAFALAHLLPARVTSASWEDVRPAWELFQSLLPDSSDALAKAELQVWGAMWRRDEGTPPSTAVSALDRCPPISLPIIHRLLQVSTFMPTWNAALFLRRQTV